MLRKIHRNRWFFWAVSIIIMATLILLYLIIEAGKDFDQLAQGPLEPASEISSDPLYLGWKSVRSRAIGVAVKYPPTWVLEIEPEEQSSINLFNPQDYSESITISAKKAEFENILRSALDISAEKKIIVDGVEGSWLASGDDSDGATSNIVLIKHSGKLFYFAGSATAFEKVLKSLKFID